MMIVYVSLLLLACMLQVPAASTLRYEAADAESCRQPNYQYGCQDGPCEFSVSWWRAADEQLVSIDLIALVPGLVEDAWAEVTVARSAQKGVFTCRWSGGETSHTRCSLTREGEVAEDGCLTANTTHHSHFLECSFVLPVTGAWSKLLSAPVSLQLNSSSFSDSEESFRQANSECPCDFRNCLDTCSCVVTDDKCHSSLSLLLIRSHAMLMVLAILLLLPTGVMIARYSRPVSPHTWFRAHVVANTTGLLFLLLGLASVLGHTGGVFNVGFHQIVGIICISLALFQVLCGFLRPVARSSPQRRVFNLVHHVVGTAVLGLGTLAMMLGAIMYHNSVHLVIVVVLAAAILVGVVFVVTMEIIMRRNYIISPPVGYHRVEGRGDGDAGEGDGDSESDKELFVREGGGGGSMKQPQTSPGKRWSQPVQPLHAHTTTKRVLTVFIIQAFVFSAVIGILISYGDH